MVETWWLALRAGGVEIDGCVKKGESVMDTEADRYRGGIILLYYRIRGRIRSLFLRNISGEVVQEKLCIDCGYLRSFKAGSVS